MSVIKNQNGLNQEKLFERIELLEKRLIKVESMLSLEWVGDREDLKAVQPEEDYTIEKAESHVIEYGLAWLGSIVFLFGIIFLMSYLAGLGYVVLSRIIAYGATFSLLAFSHLSRKSFPIITNVLNICSSILLYYITVTLHFFTSQPLISQKGIALGLLFLIIGAQLYYALRKNSQFHGALAISYCIGAAIFIDSALVTFIILTLTAITTLVLFYEKQWWKLHIFSLFMVYMAHLMWLFGNPIMGHDLGMVETPQYNLLFMFGYVLIYAVSIFIPKKKLESDITLISITIWNALAFSFILLAIIPTFYSDTYISIFISIASFCLLFAVILKMKAIRDFAPATYACIGFMALSIAIYGYAGLPNGYFLLVLQSFLVVLMALWFQSKIIVVANAFLFISILIIYLITSESIDSINFALAFTALATARILNWKRERLTLKADIYRNVYLIVALFMILLGLSKALPSQYVTLAWTATAFSFFFLSFWLKNIKYRYLSIAAIVVTAGHLFFVDLGQMEMGYRVIAFLVFAIISIGVSLYYTKRIRKKK